MSFLRKLMKNISLLQQGFTFSQFAKCCWVFITILQRAMTECASHLKDGHCQTASINEILQQKHINFLAI